MGCLARRAQKPLRCFASFGCGGLWHWFLLHVAVGCVAEGWQSASPHTGQPPAFCLRPACPCEPSIFVLAAKAVEIVLLERGGGSAILVQVWPGVATAPAPRPHWQFPLSIKPFVPTPFPLGELSAPLLPTFLMPLSSCLRPTPEPHQPALLPQLPETGGAPSMAGKVPFGPLAFSAPKLFLCWACSFCRLVLAD